MQVRLIGASNVNFVNSSTNQTILGTNIFVAFKDENVEGMRTEKFFLKEGISLPEGTKINDTLTLSFNHKGKVEMISKA